MVSVILVLVHYISLSQPLFEFLISLVLQPHSTPLCFVLFVIGFHSLIYDGMTTSFKSLIARRLIKALLLSVSLKIKHLYRIKISCHVFLYICMRIFIGGIIRLLKVKLIEALLFWKSSKRC